MKDFVQLKNDFSSLLEAGAKEIEVIGYTTQADSLRKAKESFDNKELLVVAVGEAKRGKSSLLEALIEEKGIFPIDVNVCTNIVTIVRYGEKEKIEVIIEECLDDGIVAEKTIEISRNEIPEYASEQLNKDNQKNVSCIKVEIPNEKLKQGIVFVDTPGVGSLNISHAEVTYGFLPDADVLLFVSDAGAPLTETELKFLETAHKHCKNIIFPITKIDKFSDYGTIEEDNREKISTHIGIDKNKIVIVPVSNLSKQMYLKSRNEEMYEKSNFKILEKILWQTVTDKRAFILISPFLAMMANDINTVKNDLQLKYQALSAGAKVSEQIVEKLNAEAENRKRMQSEGAKWRSVIVSELNKLASHINNTNILQLQQELNEYLSVELPVSGMANPRISKNKRENILNKVNSDIVETVFDIKQQLMDGATDLCLRINTDLALNMYVDENILDGIEFTPDDKINLKKPKLPAMDKAMTVGRMFAFGTAGGSAFGSIAGAVIGGAVGLLGGPVGAIAGAKIGASAGAVFGGAKGLGDAKRCIDGETAGDIRTALSGYITRALTSIRAMVTDVIQELNLQIPMSFQEQLNDKIEMSIRTSNEIQENNRLSKEATAAKQNELREFASKITQLEERMIELAKEIRM